MQKITENLPSLRLSSRTGKKMSDFQKKFPIPNFTWHRAPKSVNPVLILLQHNCITYVIEITDRLSTKLQRKTYQLELVYRLLCLQSNNWSTIAVMKNVQKYGKVHITKRWNCTLKDQTYHDSAVFQLNFYTNALKVQDNFNSSNVRKTCTEHVILKYLIMQ